MSSLTIPCSSMKPTYQVVVVGSGYGAAVCAARLASAGARVCVLERGREFTRFPTSATQLKEETQIDFSVGDSAFYVGRRDGLYDYRFSNDLGVVVGCGLGGTSLINAGVVEYPHPLVLTEHPAWPRAIREEARQGRLDLYFRRALAMLAPRELPDQPAPPKLRALRSGAEHLREGPWRRLPIAVHFGPEGVNRFGVPVSPCLRCGDCVAGCNFQAKLTLPFNYLPLARQHGADIFTGCEVERIVPEGPGGPYRIHFVPTGSLPRESSVVRAGTVILGGGVLGSTEILLRSRDHLPLSAQLGARLSANGDLIAFGYRCAQRIGAVGVGAEIRDRRGEPIGPTITGIIDLRTPDLARSLAIEEGVVPSALADTLGSLLAVLGGGENNASTLGQWFEHRRADLASFFGNQEGGALSRTMIYLVIGHDGAAGRLALSPEGKVRAVWPELAEHPIYQEAQQRLDRITRHLGGVPVGVPNLPVRRRRYPLTVHPLGGCPMGEDATLGVVDHEGRVFAADPTDPLRVHAGLYVADGAIVPTSLGINPLLTITALAERIAERAARRLGLAPPLETALQRLGLDEATLRGS